MGCDKAFGESSKTEWYRSHEGKSEDCFSIRREKNKRVKERIVSCFVKDINMWSKFGVLWSYNRCHDGNMERAHDLTL